MKLKGGILISPCLSVGLSVCGWTHVRRIRFASSTILAGSISFIYTTYQATSKNVSCVTVFTKFQNLNFWQFFKFVTLTLSWNERDPIWIDSKGNYGAGGGGGGGGILRTRGGGGGGGGYSQNTGGLVALVLKLILVIDGLGIPVEIAFRGLSLDHWWLVNGSNNGLVLSGNKSLSDPVLTNIS